MWILETQLPCTFPLLSPFSKPLPCFGHHSRLFVAHTTPCIHWFSLLILATCHALLSRHLPRAVDRPRAGDLITTRPRCRRRNQRITQRWRTQHQHQHQQPHMNGQPPSSSRCAPSLSQQRQQTAVASQRPVKAAARCIRSTPRPCTHHPTPTPTSTPTLNNQRFFEKYEFAAPHLLCCSDCEPLMMTELLSMADPDSLRRWSDLRLSYTEPSGLTPLREAVGQLLYKGEVATEQLLICAPEEGGWGWGFVLWLGSGVGDGVGVGVGVGCVRMMLTGQLVAADQQDWDCTHLSFMCTGVYLTMKALLQPGDRVVSVNCNPDKTGLHSAIKPLPTTSPITTKPTFQHPITTSIPPTQHHPNTNHHHPTTHY